MATGIGSGLYVVLVVLGVVLLVLWVLLPFAVFAMKDVLRKLLKEQQRTNELLMQQAPARGDRGTRPPQA